MDTSAFFTPYRQLGDVDLALVGDGYPSLGLEIKVSGTPKIAIVKLTHNYETAVTCLHDAFGDGFVGMTPVVVGPF